MIIKKVWERKTNNSNIQKLVTIPHSSDIVAGDYVTIQKVKGEQAIADINLSAIAKTKTEPEHRIKAREVLKEIGL